MNPIKNIQQAVLAGLIAITMILMALVWPFSKDSHVMKLPAEGVTTHFNYHADSLAAERQFTHVDIMHVAGDSFRIHIAGITDSIVGVHLASIEGEPFVFRSQNIGHYLNGQYIYAHEWLFLLSNERLEVVNYRTHERRWKRSFQIGQ